MRKKEKEQKKALDKQVAPQGGGMSQRGKTLDDILPDLLSGEPDDLSFKKKK